MSKEPGSAAAGQGGTVAGQSVGAVGGRADETAGGWAGCALGGQTSSAVHAVAGDVVGDLGVGFAIAPGVSVVNGPRVSAVGDLPAPWGLDPFLLAEHGRQEVLASACRADACVVAVQTIKGRVGLFGLGTARGVADLLTREVDRFAAVNSEYLILVRGAWERLSPAVQGELDVGHGSSSWDWMWLTEPTTVPSGGAVRLTPGARTDELVADCLSRAHPSASTIPGDPRILGWWGVPEGAAPERLAPGDPVPGDHEPLDLASADRMQWDAALQGSGEPGVERLIAVVGALELGPGLAPHLVSLGVDPQERGRRLADAVVSAAVRDCLKVVPAVGDSTVSLGLYALNTVARRVYERLGFKLLYEFTSRPGPD